MNEDTKLILAKLETIGQAVGVLQEDVRGLKEDVSDLKIRMDRVEEEQKNLRLILENETNKKIQIIAEGHRDLARYLNEVREFQKEKEHMKIEILNLKIDMRHVKEKLSMA